jgi:hypothetical protein
VETNTCKQLLKRPPGHIRCLFASVLVVELSLQIELRDETVIGADADPNHMSASKL